MSSESLQHNYHTDVNNKATLMTTSAYHPLSEHCLMSAVNCSVQLPEMMPSLSGEQDWDPGTETTTPRFFLCHLLLMSRKLFQQAELKGNQTLLVRALGLFRRCHLPGVWEECHWSLALFSGGGLLGGAGADDFVAGSLSSCFTVSGGGSGSFFTSTAKTRVHNEKKTHGFYQYWATVFTKRQKET